jgi:RNA ligase (TIGR02306 family)
MFCVHSQNILHFEIQKDMYKAVVTKLTNVRPHGNADRVKLATCVGNQVVIGLENAEGQLGVYFGADGQLSHEFCKANNLYRDTLLNRDPSAKPGMFDNNRRVRAQRFRGEISDGFWVPLDHFKFAGTAILVDEGFEFDELGGIPICSKYINPATARAASQNQGKKTKRAKTSVMFKEHFDTEQFGKNLHVFNDNQVIVITEKVHGTSGRIGHVRVEREITLVEKIAKFFGARVETEEWKYLNGTRRVVLEETSGTQYHDPTIRDNAFKVFNGNLRKGETVFFEIVGFESNGVPIMPPGDTLAMKDKEFTKKYGEKMFYSYGCERPNCEIYVYRMTLTNDDGQSVDYSWEDVVSRCTEIGVKVVPHIKTLTFQEIRADLLLADQNNTGVDDRDISSKFSEMVQNWGSGASLLDSRHIKEGVCVRIEGGLHNRTFKFKSFEFKVLEGIAKDTGVVDAEEAQG